MRWNAILVKLFVCVAIASPASRALGVEAVQPATSDPYEPGRKLIADFDHIVTPGGVEETFVAPLGGTRQVVNVRGADRNNPLLIYVHGGPGAVEMPFAWTFQRPWEDFFTVVQWDQRGAGRSFPLNDLKTLAPTLTPDRYRDDAIELIELLLKRYNKRKVFLLGHSWGSIVGLSVAVKRPDLLYAYIGMGQFIDPVGGERAGFDWTLNEARKDHNTRAIAELEALGPFPGVFNADIIDGERKWAVHYGALFAHRTDGDFYFHTARLSPDYSVADRASWNAGSAYTIKLLEPQLATASFVDLHTLSCPVLMFEGRFDELLPSKITEAWLDRLTAPRKKLIWFENSAHMMMVEEPGKMLKALIDDALPLAVD